MSILPIVLSIISYLILFLKSKKIIMLLEYKKYLIRSFCVNIVKISLVFSIIIIIMNLLEEISFLKNFENVIYLSIKLTLLNLPSVLFEILPFIFLISTIFFYRNF